MPIFRVEEQCFDVVGLAAEGHRLVKTEWWDAGMVICLE